VVAESREKRPSLHLMLDLHCERFGLDVRLPDDERVLSARPSDGDSDDLGGYQEEGTGRAVQRMAVKPGAPPRRPSACACTTSSFRARLELHDPPIGATLRYDSYFLTALSDETQLPFIASHSAGTAIEFESGQRRGRHERASYFHDDDQLGNRR
jgi:hypothetical protein